MIPATPADIDDVLAALMPQAERAMFPISNLLSHGLAGEHPHSVTLWLTRRAGRVTDVLTLTRGGMVMPFLPGGDFAAAARVLGGHALAGIVGPREHARGLLRALDLAGPRSLDRDEGHFLLDPAAVTVPDGPGRLVPMAQAPAATLLDWILDYQRTTLGTAPGSAAARAGEWYAHRLAGGDQMVLMDGEIALAMTGFNARVPGMVQVGGVYTPPGHRGRGYARRALALHLQRSGAARATLFTASDMARRAYEALGFRRIGDWTLVLLEAPPTAR